LRRTLPQFNLEPLEPRRILSADGSQEIVAITEFSYVSGHYDRQPHPVGREAVAAQQGEGIWLHYNNDYDDLIRIVDEKGTVQWSNDPTGSNHVERWMPASSGIFYFEFRQNQRSPGEEKNNVDPKNTYYSLAAWPDIDEFGNDAAHAQPVGDEFKARGELEGLDDQEWFEMHGEIGEQFAVKIPPSYEVTFFDADLNHVEPLVARTHPDGEQIVELKSTRSYYARISHDEDPWWVNVQYKFSITRLPADDFGNERADAAAIPINQKIDGRHAWGGDADWFKFAAKAGHTYHLYMRTERYGLTFFNLVAANGDVLVYSDMDYCCGGPIKHEAIDWTATEDGEVYIETHPRAWDDALDWPRPTAYQLSVFEREQEKTPPVSPPLLSSGEFEGKFSTPARIDWYEIHLQAGEYISIHATHEDIANPIELLLTDRDGTGPRWRGGADQFEFQASAPTTYFLRASSMDPNEIGNYQPHVQRWRDDYWSIEGSPNLISLGTPVSGAIQFDQDHDFFTFRGDPRETYKLKINFSTPRMGWVYLDDSADEVYSEKTKDGYEFTGGRVYSFEIVGMQDIFYTVEINRLPPLKEPKPVDDPPEEQPSDDSADEHETADEDTDEDEEELDDSIDWQWVDAHELVWPDDEADTLTDDSWNDAGEDWQWMDEGDVFI